MLSSARVNMASVFSPFGSTPAVSLSQDAPPGSKLDILILGCSDLQNILFTINMDERKMDFTCCDIQPAVIARNILLLSLIIDDKNGENDDSIWSIYYHFFLDAKALDLLRSQAEKLCEQSTTMQNWTKSKYGSRIRFCDSATLLDVHQLWKFYCTDFQQDFLDKAKNSYETILKGWYDKQVASQAPPNIRSALPIVFDGVFSTHKTLHGNFCRYGSTELDPAARVAVVHPNPMFLTSDEMTTIQEDIDPLHGFHAAPAYVPLRKDKDKQQDNQTVDLAEKVVLVARQEFRQWSKSYRARTRRVSLRFFVGDAVPFAHTLKDQPLSMADSANWYRSGRGFQPLVLDGPDYISQKAPLSFDVIDTSKLCDRLGSLTLLVATSPLLRNSAACVLYTEVVRKLGQNDRDVLDGLLCGDVPTLSMLLWLFPVEYWSNASPTVVHTEIRRNSGEELMALYEKYAYPGTEVFFRTRWKRPLHSGSDGYILLGMNKMEIAPKSLAEILTKVFEHMFRGDEKPWEPLKSSLYNRASFVSFLRLVKTRVSCDWKAMISEVHRHVSRRENGARQVQELFTYMHMFYVASISSLEKLKYESHSTIEPAPSAIRTILPREKGEAFRKWEDMPPVVCITLVVPRSALPEMASMNREDLNLAAIHCDVEWSKLTGIDGTTPWRATFCACQLGFGTVVTSGDRLSNSFSILVKDDRYGRSWRGTSALIVSFYVPSCLLLKEPHNVVVSSGIHGSPAATKNLYQTRLTDSQHVYITCYSPGQRGFPVARGFGGCGFTDSVVDFTFPMTDVTSGIQTFFKAYVAQGTGRITSLSGRLEFVTRDTTHSGHLRSGEIIRATNSDSHVLVTYRGDRPLFRLSFPAFLVRDSVKSATNGLESTTGFSVRVGGVTEWTNFPIAMYPIIEELERRISWGMPYLNLAKCPILDIGENIEEQLRFQLALSLSPREIAWKAEGGIALSWSELALKNLKEGMVVMCWRFATTKQYAFHIRCEHDDRHSILILRSNVRIDLSNRVVVLDCAVVDLNAEVEAKVGKSVRNLIDGGSCHGIPVSKDEMRLWEHALPVYIERCRKWPHRHTSCERERTTTASTTTKGKLLSCNCGIGEFPPHYMKDVEVWEELSKYAVRAAISPPVWPALDKVTRCRACSKIKGVDESDMLSCSRCKKVKYCSRECQVANWRIHREYCNGDAINGGGQSSGGP